MDAIKDSVSLGLTLIMVLGMTAQWISWRVKLPSIIFLLAFGFIAGPVAGWLKPDFLLGPLLFPFVSLSVAVILFEGGLSLNIADLKGIGRVVRNLISIGALVTFVLTALAAKFILGLDLQIAVLLGSILVVTGPTVIIPLLRHIRVSRQIGSILRWEGITIDPVGASLAVLVFEVISSGGFQDALHITGVVILRTIAIGLATGAIGAAFLVFVIKWRWVPDYLQETLTLMTVILVCSVSNLFMHESGLLAVTVMGIGLANQRIVQIHHILTFKENLRILLISVLFILLSARLELANILLYVTPSMLLFLLVLMFVVRPSAVFLSTIGSGLKLKEKLFLSWVAPRGIVAASVASIFALSLWKRGIDAFALAPVTFIVIIWTVVIGGITSGIVSRLLGVYEEKPQGILLVGAHDWVRELARWLKDEKIPVLLVDTSTENVIAAREEGVPVMHGSIMSEKIHQEIEIGGFGHLLAVSQNDEVNLLSVIHYADYFGKTHVFRLYPDSVENARHQKSSEQRGYGQILFGKGVTSTFLATKMIAGASIEKIVVPRDIDVNQFLKQYRENAVPMMFINTSKVVTFFTNNASVVPKAGDTLISLVSYSNASNG